MTHISQDDEFRLKANVQQRESRGHGGGLTDDLESRLGDAGLNAKQTLQAVDQLSADYKKAAAAEGDVISDWLLTSILRAFIGRGEISKLSLLRGDFQGEGGLAQRVNEHIGSSSFTAADMISARLAIAQEAIQ